MAEHASDQMSRPARRFLHRYVVIELESQHVDIGERIGLGGGPHAGIGQVADGVRGLAARGAPFEAKTKRGRVVMMGFDGLDAHAERSNPRPFVIHPHQPPRFECHEPRARAQGLTVRRVTMQRDAQTSEMTQAGVVGVIAVGVGQDNGGHARPIGPHLGHALFEHPRTQADIDEHPQSAQAHEAGVSTRAAAQDREAHDARLPPCLAGESVRRGLSVFHAAASRNAIRTHLAKHDAASSDRNPRVRFTWNQVHLSVPMSRLHISGHPIVQARLAELRATGTHPAEFRRLVHTITRLLAHEATARLATQPREVQTPLGRCDGRSIAGRFALVPILRAGLGMVEPVLDLLPEAEVWHVGLFRDETTLEPITYYSKLPHPLRADHAFVLDPMLATGGSAARACELLRNAGVNEISMLAIIAAPEGVSHLTGRMPEVSIHVGALDERLNEIGYIVPGLGDAGDRLYNTFPAPEA